MVWQLVFNVGYAKTMFLFLIFSLMLVMPKQSSFFFIFSLFPGLFFGEGGGRLFLVCIGCGVGVGCSWTGTKITTDEFY